MTTELRIAVLCGSLRTGSYNRKLLEALIEKAPAHMQFDEIPLHDVPFFNEDMEAAGDPAPVQRLKEQINQADGVLIVSPEYNGSMPAAVKNAVDWASRSRGLLAKKPFAVAGATTGTLGTAQSQVQLKGLLVHLGAYVLPNPKLLVGGVEQKIAADTGVLTDPSTLKRAERFMHEFEEWILLFTHAAEANREQG